MIQHGVPLQVFPLLIIAQIAGRLNEFYGEVADSLRRKRKRYMPSRGASAGSARNRLIAATASRSNKAAPLLLDASERGYLPAMIPLAGAYAEGKGVPKSLIEAYKWCAIAEKWNVPNAQLALDQASRELKPDELEKAKAAAAAYQFKTK